MSTPIITVENLSKRYHLGQIGATTLRESAERLMHRFRGRNPEHHMGRISSAVAITSQPRDFPVGTAPNDLWALKDVSFEVREGEVLGIIGRNGAGKSTLLKILSRVTEPTSGRAIMRGRMASLLEVGTGFHPQLTGRENIYLNGAILGMKKAEIARKFDEIVAFSEVERFLDTPVKRYSSGMYVRLAFAVAAHLEPEILVVDEVLAVGDADFQKKCIGKMGEVAQGGRTVLFVSHNMAAVQQLCGHGVVLEHGTTGFDGDIASAVTYYTKRNTAIRRRPLKDRTDRQGNGFMRFTHVDIVNAEGQSIQHIMSGVDIEVRLYYEAAAALADAAVQVSFNLVNSAGAIITSFNSRDTGLSRMPIHHSGVFVCKWPRVGLKSGTYSGTLACSVNGEVADRLPGGFELNIETGDFFGSGRVVDVAQGDVVFAHNWCSREANPA